MDWRKGSDQPLLQTESEINPKSILSMQISISEYRPL